MMSPSPLATTSIVGSSHGLYHHTAAGASRRPHRGVASRVSATSPSFASASPSRSSSGLVTYIALKVRVPANPPSFVRLPLHSPHSARSPTRAPKAALGRRGAFKKYPRTMAAVRPKLAVRPTGGVEYAWSMSNSPVSDFLDLSRSCPSSPTVESLQVPSTSAKGKVRLRPLTGYIWLCLSARLTLSICDYRALLSHNLV